jgi:hypothetical protein
MRSTDSVGVVHEQQNAGKAVWTVATIRVSGDVEGARVSFKQEGHEKSALGNTRARQCGHSFNID